MALPSPDIRQCLTDAYNDEELTALCSDYFHDVYENFAAGMTKGQKIQLLLDHCQRNDLLPALEERLERDRPEQFRARFGPNVVESRPAQAGPPPALADSQTVSTGLSALLVLGQNPKARDAIVRACADCDAVCAQLGVVRDFKTLHDQLHRLQFNCYSDLEREASRFPSETTAVDTIMESRLTLQGIISEMREVAERRSLDTGDGSWVQSIVRAQDALATAIESEDAGPLKKALYLLRSVLNVIPTIINASLKQAAKGTRLGEAVEMLGKASEYLESLQLDPDKMGQFRKAVQALEMMERGLAVLVQDHDHWQVLDVQLRREESLMQQGVSDLELSWPDLREMGLNLSRGSNETWATSLREIGDRLEQALTTKNQRDITRQFRLYRRQAAERFFRVDTDLMKQCDELALIGKSLSDVTRLLQ